MGAFEPGGSKLLALLFVISLMASFIPMWWSRSRCDAPSGAFSVMQSINPAMAVADWRSARFPSVGEIVGVALVICAVIVTFSGDAAPADVQ